MFTTVKCPKLIRAETTTTTVTTRKTTTIIIIITIMSNFDTAS